MCASAWKPAAKPAIGTAMSMDQKAAPKGALPIITFDHDVTVHLNGEDIRALHFPAGHTDGDAIVFFPKANVVHMGDDFVRYGYPFIDVIAGGSVQGMIDACDKVAAAAACRREGHPRSRPDFEPWPRCASTPSCSRKPVPPCRRPLSPARRWTR